jgi:altronate hydrolase
MGYARPGGQAGTRNYVAVISTVNCSASVCRQIAAGVGPDILRDFPGVDGVLPIVHKAGCGAQFAGPDHQQLERTLAGFARNPNVAGYVLVGLGCEVTQASRLLETQKLVQIQGASGQTGSSGRPAVLTIQEEGGIAKTVEAGVRAVMALLPRAADARRVPLSASKLVLGLQCGGSDGRSGITANPALGAASDLVVSHGGTAVLAETPEIYGAEHLLTRRAASRRVGEALVERMRWWEWYTRIFGAEINNNPTPGNKEGGLTTIYEKSLGAIAKGGTTALEAVYKYAEPIVAKGLVVMDTPGYDPVSLTGIVAGGANICGFTTGRGSVYGCKPSPCIKISTSTALFEQMKGDIDIDAGVILDGVPVEEVGAVIFEKILAVASGEKTKSELQGVGEEEFAPWSIGPTL